MSDVETVERVIAAPPEKIFPLLADAARHADFDGSGSVVGVQGKSEPLKLGSTFGMNMKIGVPYSMVSTVVEYEENRRIAWQPRLGLPIVGRFVGGRIWRYELEPVEGGTLVRESWDISRETFKPAAAVQRSVAVKSMKATLERLDALVTGAA